ncbi:unnamed protein product [Mytilus coruscus]|nr:unnamed protein product [Mytilus coruscus]
MPDIPDRRTDGISHMVKSANEVVDILNIFDVSKALGPDHVITPYDSDFTSGDSAINQLLDVTNEFEKALDDGKKLE